MHNTWWPDHSEYIGILYSNPPLLLHVSLHYIRGKRGVFVFSNFDNDRTDKRTQYEGLILILIPLLYNNLIFNIFYFFFNNLIL